MTINREIGGTFNSENQATGLVAADPALQPKEGDTLYFQPVNVRMPESVGTMLLDNSNALNGVLLSVHFANTEIHEVHGSAVLVAPGVALSAKHVIEPHMQVLVEGSKYSICVGIAGNSLQIWTVRKITLMDGCDLAILGLVLTSAMPSDRTFRQACITTRLPKIGERLQLIGFRAEQTYRVKDGEPRGIMTFGNILSSTGTVTNRYPHRRDSAMLTWPVVEVSCPTWGGMSGGPVFDENGLLVGLLCSSILDDIGGGASYISLLWPAISATYEGGWPEAAFPVPSSLMALDPRVCQIDRREAIKSFFDEATGRTSAIYESWE